MAGLLGGGGKKGGGGGGLLSGQDMALLVSASLI